MDYMKKWAEDEDEKVRRFASEGCRPRLPWAMALPKFKKDPALILPVLEKLKDDESEFVRRSVANNLNDISKDNPDIMLETCKKWYGKSENTDWIVKHACRSLLKAGDKRALMIFGYSDPAYISIENLTLEEKSVQIGNDLHYSFELVNSGSETSKVRLEYRIDFMKANGKQSGKVFKITENNYKPGSYQFKKRQSFADMSTRKHYEGEHRISIIVNGETKAGSVFNVKKVE
jgi:3-methyladenine DNA glycosylase AlkC